MYFFLHPLFALIGFCFVISLAAWRLYHRRSIVIRFPFAQVLPKLQGPLLSPRMILWFLRTSILLLLVLVTARFMKVREHLPVEGIDIMMVFDVSGSMNLFDKPDDRKTRIQIAREQAMRFVKKRPDDMVGLIIFAAGAVVRCPLTFDKKIIEEILPALSTVLLNPDGTMISAAIALATRRLSLSSAKQKIIILLTDGAPSEGDLRPEIALETLKEAHVKVYAIGIGGENGGYLDHPMYGLIRMPTPLNRELLSWYAQQTGGAFFEAKNEEEVQTIYDTINRLEKTEREIPSWMRYEDKGVLLLPLILVLMILEILLRMIWCLL
jgi:Ca-activated chloride channel homolog